MRQMGLSVEQEFSRTQNNLESSKKTGHFPFAKIPIKLDISLLLVQVPILTILGIDRQEGL